MQIIFIGTGGSWPSKERNVSAVAVRVNRDIVLFDCGEGTQRQFMHAGISFMRISRIFISHYHGDHFLGMPGLIQTMCFNNRKNPLEIYGPRGTSEIIENLLRLGYFEPSFKIKTGDLDNNDILEYEDYCVKVKCAEHTVPTLAYALEEQHKPGRFNIKKAEQLGIPPGPLYRQLQQGKSITFKGRKITSDMVLGKPRKGRKIVYANDTRPCKNITELAKNCDALIHDATVHSELEKKANDYGHSSARQAAETAKTAKAKLLFLIHFSPRYKNTDVLEREARKIFKNSTAAEDFMIYDVR